MDPDREEVLTQRECEMADAEGQLEIPLPTRQTKGRASCYLQ